MSRYFRRPALKGVRRASSWHRYSFTSRGGQTKARCGYWVQEEPEWSSEPPLTERGCESCSRLTLRDIERAEAEPDSDPVTG